MKSVHLPAFPVKLSWLILAVLLTLPSSLHSYLYFMANCPDRARATAWFGKKNVFINEAELSSSIEVMRCIKHLKKF